MNEKLITALQNNDDEALLEIELEDLKNNPSDFELNKLIALTYSNMSEYEKCIEYIDRYLEHDINIYDEADSYYIKGQAYIGLNDFDSAIGFYDKALELLPNHELCNLGKAMVCKSRKNFDEALFCIDRLSDENPAKNQLKVTLYSEMGNWEKCFEYIDSENNLIFKPTTLFNMNQYEKSIELIDNLIKNGDTTLEMMSANLALDNLGLQHPEIADEIELKIEDLENHEKINGLIEQLDDCWAKFYARAIGQKDMIKYIEAIENLKRALEYDEHRYETLIDLADTYILIDDYKNAREITEKALEINESVRPLELMCTISFATEEFVDCISYSNRILNMDKENYDTYITMAFAYHALEESDMAIEILDEAIESNPKSNRFYMAKGTIYEEMDDEKKYIECIIKAYEIDPFDIMPMVSLTSHFKEKGNMGKARRYYDEILTLEPNFPKSFEEL